MAFTTYTPARLLNPSYLPNTETTTTPGLLSAAVATSHAFKISEIVLCNTGGTAATASISVVPSGGTGGASNRIISATTLQPAETKVFDFAIMMNAGDFLSGLASAATAVTITVSGVDMV